MLLAKEYGIEKFIHASTGSVYGALQESPQTEKHPLSPCSYYGVSKLAGERYVDFMDVNSVILRYFHVYGPKQNNIFPTGGVIAIFITQALLNEKITIFGDGSQIRTFTFVDDIVEANLKSTIYPQAEDQVYICSSGYRTELIEIVNKLNEIFDQEIKTQAPELIKILNTPYKFLPPQYSSTGAIDIFGDRIVTFSGLTLKNISDDVTLTVIVNKELADCYRTWFQFIWDNCKK
jgi:nucleoside-diphosphate-sugar epimerase